MVDLLTWRSSATSCVESDLLDAIPIPPLDHSYYFMILYYICFVELVQGRGTQKLYAVSYQIVPFRTTCSFRPCPVYPFSYRFARKSGQTLGTQGLSQYNTLRTENCTNDTKHQTLRRYSHERRLLRKNSPHQPDHRRDQGRASGSGSGEEIHRRPRSRHQDPL